MKLGGVGDDFLRWFMIGFKKMKFQKLMILKRWMKYSLKKKWTVDDLFNKMKLFWMNFDKFTINNLIWSVFLKIRSNQI